MPNRGGLRRQRHRKVHDDGWTDFRALVGDDATPANYFDYVHPGDRERVAAALESLFAHGHRFDVEYRVRCRDGRYRWVRGVAWVQRRINGVAERRGYVMLTGGDHVCLDARCVCRSLLYHNCPEGQCLCRVLYALPSLGGFLWLIGGFAAAMMSGF